MMAIPLVVVVPGQCELEVVDFQPVFRAEETIGIVRQLRRCELRPVMDDQPPDRSAGLEPELKYENFVPKRFQRVPGHTKECLHRLLTVRS